MGLSHSSFLLLSVYQTQAIKSCPHMTQAVNISDAMKAKTLTTRFVVLFIVRLCVHSLHLQQINNLL